MSKWLKNKGTITITIEDETYDIMLTSEELPLYFDVSRKMASGKSTNVEKEKELTRLLLQLCKQGLKNANPDVDEKILNDFADNNSFVLVTHLMRILGGK